MKDLSPHKFIGPQKLF